jgi:hypothetical protein
MTKSGELFLHELKIKFKTNNKNNMYKQYNLKICFYVKNCKI